MLPYLHQVGAAKVFWFQLFENSSDSSGYGLLDANLKPKPAYLALKSLIAKTGN